MLNVIQNNQSAIEQLCRRYDVRRLELFGSAADGSFDAQHSDLDFLIAFNRPSTIPPFDQYFGLLLGLKQLLGHDIDLIEPDTVTNPYMLKAIERSTKQVVYDAA